MGRPQRFTQYCLQLSMWADYRGSLSTVYSSNYSQIIQVHSVLSTAQHVGRLYRFAQYCLQLSMWADYRGSLSTVYSSACGQIIQVHSVYTVYSSACGQTTEVHLVLSTAQHVGRLYRFTQYCLQLSMWSDYTGSLSTVYHEVEISTCGQITEAYPLVLSRCISDETPAHGQFIKVHFVPLTVIT